MNALVTRSAVALSMAAVLVGPCLAARADQRIETVLAVPSITVSYRELDLSKPSGLEVLYSRIQRAAKSVCSFEPSPRELARTRAARACYRTAVDDAVKQVNRPMFTALHQAKSKQVLG